MPESLVLLITCFAGDGGVNPALQVWGGFGYVREVCLFYPCNAFTPTSPSACALIASAAACDPAAVVK